MSDYETHVGTLTKVQTDLTAEEFCKLRLSERGKKVDPQSFVEYYRSGFKDLIFYKDDIYSVEDIGVKDDSDIFYGRQVAPGRIEFVTRFYNGGCSLLEALEECLEKME